MAQATFDIGHITLGDDRLEAAVAIMPALHWGPASVGEHEELLTTTRQEIHLVAGRRSCSHRLTRRGVRVRPVDVHHIPAPRAHHEVHVSPASILTNGSW